MCSKKTLLICSATFVIAMSAHARKATSFDDALRIHLADAMDQKKVGVAAMVIKVTKTGDVNVIYERDFGINNNKEHPTRLHLASLSKQFT